MKKLSVVFMLMAALLIFGCASGGSSSGQAPSGSDPTTILFRHFLGKYVQENWNATNTNEAVLNTILEHEYVFVGGRKTLDYFEYFILEKRASGPVMPLNIKSITLTADGEQIVLDLQDLAAVAAFSGAPLAPSTFANGVLSVKYPNAFVALERMPRLAVTIPEAAKPKLVSASRVSVKIELAD